MMKICGTFILIIIAVIFSFMPSVEVAARTIRGSVCTSNRNCAYMEACYGNTCVEVCHLQKQIEIWQKCATNAFCYPKGKHTAGCKCNSGHKGDPYLTGCVKNQRIGSKVAESPSYEA